MKQIYVVEESSRNCEGGLMPFRITRITDSLDGIVTGTPEELRTLIRDDLLASRTVTFYLDQSRKCVRITPALHD